MGEETTHWNWETKEVWEWLNADEGVYQELDAMIRSYGWTGRDVFLYVGQGNAPQGLYQSFEREPRSNLRVPRNNSWPNWSPI